MRPAPDRTLQFLRNPYGVLAGEAERSGADVFDLRLLMMRVTGMTGHDAARLLYDPDLFTRHGAAPMRLQKTLFGVGGVQGLDGPAHTLRKRALTDLVTGEPVRELVAEVQALWPEYVEQWSRRPSISLYDELRGLLTRAACAWTGVPLPPGQVARRTRQVSLLFDAASAVGPRHWAARRARSELDRWLTGLVRDIRGGDAPVRSGAAAEVVAGLTGDDGELLPPRVAAVELLNIVRPTVAAAVWLTHLAHALHVFPEWRHRLASAAAGSSEDECFVQEVRRHYPFFPAVPAVVRRDFEWHGHRFARGDRVLFDLHGTDHDARLWTDPERFDPDRFSEGLPDPFTFVPQGGGEVGAGHRCPGEPVCVALMRVGLDRLARRTNYRVEPGAERFDSSRLPALAAGGFRISVSFP